MAAKAIEKSGKRRGDSNTLGGLRDVPYRYLVNAYTTLGGRLYRISGERRIYGVHAGCPNCGGHFLKSYRSKSDYCGVECYQESPFRTLWVGRRNASVKDYKKASIRLAKQLTRDRAGGVCQRCLASDKQIHAHHVIPVRYGHTAALLDNLVPICVGCHVFGKDAAHQHPHAFQRWYDEKYPGLWEKNWKIAQNTEKIDWQLTYERLSGSIQG